MSDSRSIILKNASILRNFKKMRDGISLVNLQVDSQNKFMWSKFQKDEHKGKQAEKTTIPGNTPPTISLPQGPSSLRPDAKTTLQFDDSQNPKIDKILKSSVVFFDFSNTYITDMSFLKTAKTFEKVTTMTLMNIGLTEISKALYSLPKTLRYLDLSYNSIRDIPQKIKWQNLHGISLAHNCFTRWPENLKTQNLPELQYLNASWNNFSSGIPENMEFSQLQSIDLSYCNLFIFPVFIMNSTSLRMIDLSGNSKLSNLTISIIEKFIVLRYLNISEVPCNFDHIPKTLIPDLIIAHCCDNVSFPQNTNTTIYL